jgi:hypothetical protein
VTLINPYIFATGGGGAVLPTDYANLELWLDADQITGLVDGNAVSPWTDQSGNGFDASNGTAGSRPLYKTNIINGLPTVLFDGSDDFLTLASAANLDLTADFSVFVVMRFVTVNRGSTVQNTVLSKDFTRYEFYEYQTVQGGYVGGTSNAVNSASSTLAAATNYILEWHRSGSSLTTVNNGTQVGTATNSASASGGNPLYIGVRPGGGGGYIHAHYGEIVIYDEARTAGEKTDLRAALASKWGITV